MPRFLAAAVAVAFLAPVVRADVELYSYAFLKQYIVTISDEALEKSPTWNDEADNPPISAKKAIKLANEMKDSLVNDSKDFKWTLRSASLVPAGKDKWYWSIRYEAVFQGVSSGIPNHLRLVVLMDGTVVKPEVKNRD